jgi:hypothetical protein
MHQSLLFLAPPEAEGLGAALFEADDPIWNGVSLINQR